MAFETEPVMPNHRKREVLLLSILTAALLLAAGCGSARRSPPEKLSEEAQLGRLVFFSHCHQCHPGGEAGLGPALNNKPLPGFLIRFQVRRGLGAMPAFSTIQVTEAELDRLVTYTQTLRRGGRSMGHSAGERSTESGGRKGQSPRGEQP